MRAAQVALNSGMDAHGCLLLVHAAAVPCWLAPKGLAGERCSPRSQTLTTRCFFKSA